MRPLDRVNPCHWDAVSRITTAHGHLAAILRPTVQPTCSEMQTNQARRLVAHPLIQARLGIDRHDESVLQELFSNGMLR